MFGFKYIKFDSMDYVIHYRNGKPRKEGTGLSFYYFAPSSSIVSIPIKSIDLPFIFNEMTSDFQELAVQGQITIKISEPGKLSKHLDFTVSPRKAYRTDDIEKLKQRIINEAQTTAAFYIHSHSITQSLGKQSELEEIILTGMKNSKLLEELGVDMLSVHVLGISANPEMARALEAKTREAIQKDADQAIYDRRNFAVEQERKIKESELNTEIAVEEKQKQIVEKKMETDVVKRENDRKLKEMEIETAIQVEEQNTEFIRIKTENEKKEADAKEYLLQKVMDVYKDVDWKTITALSNQPADAASNIALAFRELAENSSKIGTLNITPDLLESLVPQKAES